MKLHCTHNKFDLIVNYTSLKAEKVPQVPWKEQAVTYTERVAESTNFVVSELKRLAVFNLLSKALSKCLIKRKLKKKNKTIRTVLDVSS